MYQTIQLICGDGKELCKYEFQKYMENIKILIKQFLF